MSVIFKETKVEAQARVLLLAVATLTRPRAGRLSVTFFRVPAVIVDPAVSLHGGTGKVPWFNAKRGSLKTLSRAWRFYVSLVLDVT